MAIRKTYTGLHLFTLANKLRFCFSSTSFETFSREIGQYCELVTKCPVIKDISTNNKLNIWCLSCLCAKKLTQCSFYQSSLLWTNGLPSPLLLLIPIHPIATIVFFPLCVQNVVERLLKSIPLSFHPCFSSFFIWCTLCTKFGRMAPVKTPSFYHIWKTNLEDMIDFCTKSWLLWESKLMFPQVSFWCCLLLCYIFIKFPTLRSWSLIPSHDPIELQDVQRIKNQITTFSSSQKVSMCERNKFSI